VNGIQTFVRRVILIANTDKINTLSTPADTVKITKDALNLYDKDVLGQRHFEIMSLLNIVHKQQTNFRMDYPALNSSVDGQEPPGYTTEQLPRSTATLGVLQNGLGKLRSCAQEDILSSILEEAETFCVEDRFARDIQFWVQDFEAGLLWVQGPLSQDFSALACASILGAAQEADIPTLQYFCRQEVAQSPTNLDETDLLVRLTYSFIYQLLKFSLDDLSSRDGLRLGNIHQLDGSAGSLAEALVILQGLLAARSQDFLIIIDGVHLIEDPSIRDQAYVLFDTLRQCNKTSVNGLSMSKILLGTSGQTPLLENMIGVDEQLDATRSTKGALCLRTTLSAEDFK
jgi:hypothetical protein